MHFSFYNFIDLFIFLRTRSSLLLLLFSGCGERGPLESRAVGFSRRRLLLLQSWGFRMLGLQYLRCLRLYALQYIGSSWIRDRTCVCCIGRRILHPWPARGTPKHFLTADFLTSRINSHGTMHFKCTDPERGRDAPSAPVKRTDDTDINTPRMWAFSRMVLCLYPNPQLLEGLRKCLPPRNWKPTRTWERCVWLPLSFLLKVFYVLMADQSTISSWKSVISVNAYPFPFQKLYLLLTELDVSEFLPKCLGVNTPLSKVKGERHRDGRMVLIFSKRKKTKEEAQMIQWLAEGHLVIQRKQW